MRRIAKGFTLIELMIVIVVIAILMVIAVPTYQDYVRRANRTDAKNELMRIAAEQEKFFTTFHRYSGSIDGPRTGNPADSGLAMRASTQEDASDRAYYDLTIALGANNRAYTLTATPQGAFQSVDACGALTITNTGVRAALGASAPADCW